MSAVTRERLSVDDAQILRLESAAIKGHTGKVLILAPDSKGRSIAASALRERISQRMDTFPRLSQRVAEPRLGLGRPAWVEAPDVDLAWHVAEPDRADPLADEELRQAVGELLSERLDHTRPLWRLDVLPLTGDRVAIVGRIHHAMADGVSAIRLVAGLLWDEDSAPASAPAPTATGAARSRPPSTRPRQPRARRPREARILVAAPGALWRELRPGRDTRLDQHIGPAREVAWTSFPLERLKRIEHGAARGGDGERRVLAVVRRGPPPMAAPGRRDRRRPPRSVPRLPARPRGGEGPARQPRLLHERRPADLRGRPSPAPAHDQRGDRASGSSITTPTRSTPSSTPSARFRPLYKRRDPPDLGPPRVRPLGLERARARDSGR